MSECTWKKYTIKGVTLVSLGIYDHIFCANIMEMMCCFVHKDSSCSLDEFDIDVKEQEVM